MTSPTTSPTWEQALDARLVRRLRRPLVRPGVVELRQARSILERHLGMTPGLPLLDVVARGDGLADGPAAAVPIVYARPPGFVYETSRSSAGSRTQNPSGTEVIQRLVDPAGPERFVYGISRSSARSRTQNPSGAGTPPEAGAPPVVTTDPRTEVTRHPVELLARPVPPAQPVHVVVPAPEARGGPRGSGAGTLVVVAPTVREQVVREQVVREQVIRELAVAGNPAAPSWSAPSWSPSSWSLPWSPPMAGAVVGAVPTPAVAGPAAVPVAGSATGLAPILPMPAQPAGGPAYAAMDRSPALPLPLAGPLPLATPGSVYGTSRSSEMSRTQNRPVPPEPHRATVVAGRERDASEPGRRAKVSAVDVDRIVDTVHRRFLRQLAIERERRGVR